MDWEAGIILIDFRVHLASRKEEMSDSLYIFRHPALEAVLNICRIVLCLQHGWSAYGKCMCVLLETLYNECDGILKVLAMNELKRY